MDKPLCSNPSTILSLSENDRPSWLKCFKCVGDLTLVPKGATNYSPGIGIANINFSAKLVEIGNTKG